jgi:hypothetical protein
MSSIAKVRHQVRAAAVSLAKEIVEGRTIDKVYLSVIAVTANLTHLLILLMEELPFSCAEVVCEPELLGAVIKMLELTRDFVCASPENPNPQWTAPFLLLLDTWEKVAMMYNNRQKPREVKKCFKKRCVKF